MLVDDNRLNLRVEKEILEKAGLYVDTVQNGQEALFMIKETKYDLILFEYSELKTAYFTPTPTDMLNDGFLGVSVITIGMMIWLFLLIIGKKRTDIKK